MLRHLFAWRVSFIIFAVAIVLAQVPFAWSQTDHEREPISYSTSAPTDPVSQLAAAVADGEATLEWDQEHGWLKSLLAKLDVPQSSQTLVFSKTSLQFRRITPRYPRAIYFNDEVYVGWVHRGDVLELGAVDPKPPTQIPRRNGENDEE